jgi:hypothetical protein
MTVSELIEALKQHDGAQTVAFEVVKYKGSALYPIHDRVFAQKARRAGNDLTLVVLRAGKWPKPTS